MPGGDTPLAGAAPPLTARSALHAERLGVLVDLGARAARTLAQCHGEIGGGEVGGARGGEGAADGRGGGAAAPLDGGAELPGPRGREKGGWGKRGDLRGRRVIIKKK